MLFRSTYLPLQAWNTIDLRKVTTEIGHITAIIPYGRPAGHYRHIILRVSCEDPADIPMHIKYHEGDLATRVRVRLLSSRDYEPGPFPLHIHNGNPQAPPPQPPQQPQQPQPQQQVPPPNQQDSGMTSHPIMQMQAVGDQTVSMAQEGGHFSLLDPR